MLRLVSTYHLSDSLIQAGVGVESSRNRCTSLRPSLKMVTSGIPSRCNAMCHGTKALPKYSDNKVQPGNHDPDLRSGSHNVWRNSRGSTTLNISFRGQGHTCFFWWEFHECEQRMGLAPTPKRCEVPHYEIIEIVQHDHQWRLAGSMAFSTPRCSKGLEDWPLGFSEPQRMTYRRIVS